MRPHTLPVVLLWIFLEITVGASFPHSNQWTADFHDAAAQWGLIDPLPNGGNDSKRYILETTGSGAAFLDFDNDGHLDVFLVSGLSSNEDTTSTSRLYRNSGTRFTDVSRQFSVQRSGWGQGICAGDYDNDGYIDLFVTYWGRNVLYRNLEGRTFQDETAQARLLQKSVRYNTGCSFFDFDRDGDLDLFVANYLEFDFETAPKPGENPFCWYRGLPVNCGPRGLPFGRNILYRNDGDGRFTDVSHSSGVSRPARHYSLGVLTGDFDNDAWTDVYVACDQTPSLLYMNQRDGTFREEALLRGAAFDESGKALSGMGVAAGDYDANGWLDIFRTNFSDERSTLYRNRGQGQFDDVNVAAGMGHNTRFVGWGCSFFDFDNDGWKDLFLVNGHIYPEVEQLKIDVRYADRAVLYWNRGNGAFRDISEEAGPAIRERRVSRGAAVGDIDNDGNLEMLINNQNHAPALLRQNPRRGNNWIILRLEGVVSNRSAIGARVLLTARGHTQVQEVRSGGSYLSQHDLRLHFGLGKAESVEKIEIRWPSGIRQTERNIAVNRIFHLRERQTEPRP